MKIKLEKTSGRAKCRNLKCKHNPDYISQAGRIKTGTQCVAITMDSAAGWNTSYYCRDCVEEMYLLLKTYLNPSYWAVM